MGVITLEMLVRMLVMGLWKYLGPKLFQKFLRCIFFGDPSTILLRELHHSTHQSHRRDTFNINLKSQQSNASDISRIYMYILYIYASGGSIAVVGFSIQSACCIFFQT